MNNDTTPGPEEPALFDAPTGAELERKKPAPKKAATRRTPKEVARTPTGESAADIIASWIDWVKAGSGVSVPPNVIARLSKCVRGLILNDFTTDQIKYGLAFWAVEEQENPRTAPEHLERLVWRYARDTSAQHQVWVRQMKEAVYTFAARQNVTAPGAASSAWASRAALSEAAKAEWLAKSEEA